MRRHQIDCRQELKIVEKYELYLRELLAILSKPDWVQEEKLVRVTIGSYNIQLTGYYVHLVRRALFQGRKIVGGLAYTKNSYALREDFMELAIKDLAIPIYL